MSEPMRLSGVLPSGDSFAFVMWADLIVLRANDKVCISASWMTLDKAQRAKEALNELVATDARDGT